MAKYKIVALPKQAEYMELDLTPEEIQEYAKGGYIIEDVSVPTLNQMQYGGEEDFYTVEGSNGVYRKIGNKWEVDWNKSGNFQPLSKGDVKSRTAVLNKNAKPLYDSTYNDLYRTKQSAYTAPEKSAPAKKPTAQNKAQQEQFDKNFQVTDKSKMEVVEDKIQKTADDYVNYHQQLTGQPLTKEEYDAAYQDIYNRAYVDAGMYKPTMSGPTINPYGTTEERKNLVSLDPGKAPKNMTLGDYVDKGWDIVTNPLDYASYALKPKGTVAIPWNMTNYENRLEAAGLEDPVTANNSVNQAIDFASWFTPAGMVAQGLKMIPGTVNSIGKAFEEPTWENTGNALFNTGMTALSVAPGFGVAKNLAKRASTVDDLKAIEALRGNTATTPFQSYYLTGNRGLGASEAAVQQSEALRKFIEPQSPQLPTGRSPIMSESTRTQLTNPAVDSYFPVRFGDESYAAAGNEHYFVDPADYAAFNPETKQFEPNPNWKKEGLTDYYNYPNRESKRGYGPDLFKDINYEFKDFSPGWQVGQDAKELLMQPQRMPKKSDYLSESEFQTMLIKEMEYNILDDERKIQEVVLGRKISDEEFVQMNPGVIRPNFNQKLLTPEQRSIVNDLLRDNPSVKSNPLLKENLKAAIERSEKIENTLGKNQQDFGKNNPFNSGDIDPMIYNVDGSSLPYDNSSYKATYDKLRHVLLPESKSKNGNEMINDFMGRLKSPEGQRRLKALGIDNVSVFRDLVLKEIDHELAYFTQALGQPYVGLHKDMPENIARQITRHELEHAIDRAYRQSLNESGFNRMADDRLTSINHDLKKLTLKGEPNPKDKTSFANRVSTWDPVQFPKVSELFNNQQSYIDYFVHGSDGGEMAPFLAEVQEGLLQNNMVKHAHDNITSKTVEDFYYDYMNNPDPDKFVLRYFEIMEPTKQNFKLTAEQLNKMLMLSGVIVGGKTMLDSDSELMRTNKIKYLLGGNIKESKLRKFID